MGSPLVIITLFALVAACAAQTPAPRSMADYKADLATAATAATAKAAKQSKMGPVDKVMELLQGLKTKVTAEGEEEAKTYAAVCRQCKTLKDDKNADIGVEKNDVSGLQAEESDLDSDQNGLGEDIEEDVEELTEAEKAKRLAKRTHVNATALYNTNKADMMAAVASLDNAIKTMKAGKTSLVQIQSIGQTVSQAMLLADALGLASAKKTIALLQDGADDAPEVEMENYKFHSASITETLESLLEEFRKQKNTLDTDEVNRVQAFKLLWQSTTDEETAVTHDMNGIKKPSRANKIAEFGAANAQEATVAAQLADDISFLDLTTQSCKQKEDTFNQRLATRTSELTALSAAMGVIASTVSDRTTASTVRLAQTGVSIHIAGAVASSESAMEAIEAEAESTEEGSPVLLQTGSSIIKHFLQKQVVKVHSPADTRDMVISLFKGKGQQLHSSALMAMAAQVSADPLEKVKHLVAELIERLLTSAADDTTHKGWCDKAQGDAEQKRQYASEDVSSLNAKAGTLEALSEKLGEELATLANQLAELKKVKGDTQSERNAEKRENANAVADAKSGLAAVREASRDLSRFYGTAENEASAAADAFATNSSTGVKDAYAGAAAEAGGVIAMMDVIGGDFKRTILQIDRNEAEADEMHLNFMTGTLSSIAKKKVATSEKTKFKGETEGNLRDVNSELNTKTTALNTSIAELLQLKEACQPTGQSKADRDAMRQQEIASLKKGLCIINNQADAAVADDC